MGSWLVKAAVQGAMSLAPNRTRINAIAQRRTGRLALDGARFDKKVGYAARHLRRYGRAGGRGTPRAALEVGTGWYPIVPVALALAGVERVVSLDVTPLTEPARIATTLDAFAVAADDGRLERLLAGRVDARRLAALRGGGDPEARLAALGVELRVADARATGLPPASFDLLVSSNTFEHVPPGELRAVARELHRLAVEGGVTDHFIDMRDHYANLDPSISRLNFLRFPDAVWRVANNRLQYQSRLRLPDYVGILREAGWDVRRVWRLRGADGEFDGLRLAKRFRDGYERDEALVLFAWVSGVKRARAAG